MLWRVLELESSPRPRFSRGNLSGTATDPEIMPRFDDLALAGEKGKGTLVLRILIEDFGGEATSSCLLGGSVLRYRPVDRLEGPSRIQIRAVLDQLASCGALTLEGLGESDVIARITPAGASLAYAELYPKCVEPKLRKTGARLSSSTG